ncbi:adipocyte plasma membrane-associated protein isoform X1 [Megalobrama amblycephala]|uniref:adipocyte plasma membrane-associated protein isoform X1 n=1 Tax=Megalobrama amblycephala TaxID=75352 RepID=UPI00201429F1|nr:adipocyte plasma membrane-associated protein isoform X1 [Megalobrama amblycephala]
MASWNTRSTFDNYHNRLHDTTMLGQSSIRVVLLAVAVGLYLIPSPIDPEPYIFEGPPPALEGPLAVNTRLQRGRRLFSGQLKGPESFTADQNGNIYTGTVDGKLWRINKESLTFITQMGRNIPECGTSTDYEPVCGRPHGLRLDRDGQLIVADSYQGLFKIDPWTGEKTLLHSSKEGADGIPFGFLNGLEISKNGTMFFTDSSSKWGRRHVRYEVLETNHLGRLLSYDPVTGHVRTLLDSLYMPNGFAFSSDEDFLLLAETSIGRIIKFWLKGPKAGTREIVLNNMIGYPDNIRLSDRGTFLVGISTVRFRGRLFPPFLDLIGPYPTLKRFIVKLIPLSWYNALLPKYGLILELGPDGEVIDSLHDPTGSLTWAVSDVFQQGAHYYLGSTDLPFLPVLEEWS